MIPLSNFLDLPDNEVAALVHAAGPQVCVFPINGTRRWFLLEHGGNLGDDPLGTYMDISAANHIALYRMFFAHGIDTLLTPVIGPDILLRGEEYVQRIAGEGLARLAQGQDFLDFYDSEEVRVHFYGDHRCALAATPYAYLSNLFDQSEEHTRDHQRSRLFFGVFASEASEHVATFAAEYARTHGQPPDRRAIVADYYGEVIEPATIFIGFDRFSVFDYPLLSMGTEDLYFTVAPSPYLTPAGLRTILYDHLYTRRAPEPDYSDLPPQALRDLRHYYHCHQMQVLGVGRQEHGIWRPILQQDGT